MRSSCQWQEESKVVTSLSISSCPQLSLLHSFQNLTSILFFFFYFISVTIFFFFTTCSHVYLPCLSSITQMSWVFTAKISAVKIPVFSVCGFSPLKLPTWVFEFCFSRILPWLTVLTVTTARNPCMAASTSNQTTAHTASHVTTAFSQTLVMSVKSWLAMTQGWEAFWHDQTRSWLGWNIIYDYMCSY